MPVSRGPSGDGPECVAKGAGGLLRRTEREPLGFQIRVLDGEVEDAPVELAILGEPVRELLEQSRFFRIAERLKQRVEGVHVLLDRVGRLPGLARKRGRRVVGVGHDRAVGGVGGLRELEKQVCVESTGFRHLVQYLIDVGAATGRDADEEHEDERGNRLMARHDRKR